ncbi:Possible transcription activator protein hfaB [hydrothermal vent metagenome]|uniref:Possible transcription activator protein hfaB n=1 Tax=hydrothermal vent metagenome TaxID=652676 RepID=A0A3B0RRC8_9ZZZZ
MTKKTALLMRTRIPALLVAGAVALASCASPTAGRNGLYAQPSGGAPVTANPTPYSAALACLGGYVRSSNVNAPRIAVGRIIDYTGKSELEGGRKITQGASLMAISAFAKAGMRLVERYDTSVSELELKYANNKLISDGGQGYRKIKAGSVPGSDFYLVGGITELNYNIASSGIDAFGGDVDVDDPKGFLKASTYVMNIGLDLRLVDTKSLEVVDVISYQKQIVGYEIGAGIFAFFNNQNIIDVSAGSKTLEPMQLAVRSSIERAVLEMTANLYGVAGPDVCSYFDPLATTGTTGNFINAHDNLEANNGYTRQDPNRWHSDRDDTIRTSLRGRYK